MRAEKAVDYLLKNASGLTALLANGAGSIYPGYVPQSYQGTGAPQTGFLPAVTYEVISGQELTTIDALSAFGLCQARMQITAIASGATGDGYASVKAVLEQVRLALNYQRGTFNGVRVVSIIRDTVGPDLRDDDRQLYTQSLDFQITYQEP
jgi:hypothetical protein